MSQPALAAAADVSKGYIFSLEAGEQENPSLGVMLKIADALGVTIADLVNAPVTTRAAPAAVEVPESLKRFAARRRRAGQPVTHEEMEMLMAIQLRGRRPESVTDWEFLYEAIRRTVRKQDGEEEEEEA